MKTTITTLLLGTITLFSCEKKDDTTTTSNETRIINVQTFQNTKVGFGEGLSQSAEGTFTFPSEQENVKSIKVYIKDICPNKTCDEWDRYANLYVKDKTTGVWYEMGRFITPYWVGTEKLERGLEIDVTDFKSLLSGETELKIYTETWLSKGRTYTIDFDVELGTPDYKYYSVAPVIQYNQSSLHGVPYGVSHDKDLTKSILLPSGTEAAQLRTIITGWGHATPYDAGGRPCAEWCYRTHYVWINNVQTFEHELGPLNCASNPINNQAPGNWQPNRAGWCPGMVVPNRIDVLNPELFSNNINFEYKFTDWTNNGQNGDAFYAISTFVIAKSNNPIQKPVVQN